MRRPTQLGLRCPQTRRSMERENKEKLFDSIRAVVLKYKRFVPLPVKVHRLEMEGQFAVSLPQNSSGLKFNYTVVKVSSTIFRTNIYFLKIILSKLNPELIDFYLGSVTAYFNSRLIPLFALVCPIIYANPNAATVTLFCCTLLFG